MLRLLKNKEGKSSSCFLTSFLPPYTLTTPFSYILFLNKGLFLLISLFLPPQPQVCLKMAFHIGFLTHQLGKGASATLGLDPLSRVVPPLLYALCSPRFSEGPPEGMNTPSRARGKLKVCSGTAQCVYQLLLFPRENG